MITFKYLKNDLPAALVVFLVALPLCLGIALASGAPLLSGLIAGICGGIVVGSLSGSQTSISGPAAGLAAVVLSGLTRLEQFDVFLLALVIAGVIQFGLGLLKAGFIANFVPSNVIKGLLAAIGIILILKQLPHAIGFDRDAEGEFSFNQPDGDNTISALGTMLDFITPAALIISAISLFIMIFWKKIPGIKNIKLLPASLIVVLLGVAINEVLKTIGDGMGLQPEHMVTLPKVDLNNPTSLIVTPNFAAIGSVSVWIVAFTIALVASLETLLNIEAIDNIDPLKRQTPPNRELLAQGAGNVVSGLIGGIPITSVIVRSTANFDAGGRTKLVTITHGILLLLSIVALGSVLNRIPLASLAAILIVIGYKLAKVSIFKDMWKKGLNQFIPFVVTIAAIVFTDLLIGILIGLGVSIIFLLRSNYRAPFSIKTQRKHEGEIFRFELPTQVSFLNKASLKDALWGVAPGSRVVIDARTAKFIDDDVLELIKDYQSAFAPQNSIRLNVIGMRDSYKLPNQVQFVDYYDKDAQTKLSPADVLELLKDGNQRFVSDTSIEKYYAHQVYATASGQHPIAVFLCCIDSRTSPDIVFDAGLGELLCVRVAGNVITPEVVDSIEIACEKLGAKLIVIMGHSGCGAVRVSALRYADGNRDGVANKIIPAIESLNAPKDSSIVSDNDLMERASEINTENAMLDLLAASPYTRNAIADGSIGLIASFYDTASGNVTFGTMNTAKLPAMKKAEPEPALAT